MENKTIEWLMGGDVSIQYLVSRDLLQDDPGTTAALRARIPNEGWGRTFLAAQRSDGNWGQAYYQPKWISTHYTLLDLMALGIPPDTPGPLKAVNLTIEKFLKADGELQFAGNGTVSDDCVSAMFLSAAAYFNADEGQLDKLAGFLLTRRMPDGGWNCRSARSGAVHSSVHTTISCLEGLRQYRERRPDHRSGEFLAAIRSAEEFLLSHRLYRSHRTGLPMDRRMLMLSWPARWYYDILRALEYFADSGHGWNPRMKDAMDVLVSKRRSDGAWPVQNFHPGEVHFMMEKTGGPSRWNTYRALKVLKAYPVEDSDLTA